MPPNTLMVEKSKEIDENWEEISRLSIADQSIESNSNQSSIENQALLSVIESPKETCLKITWSFRDELIICFNKLTSLIFKKISNDDLKILVDKLDQFIISLTCLPSSSSDEDEFRKKMKLIGKQVQTKNELVLTINEDIRSQLINQLIKNKNLAILNEESATNADRNKLVNKNNRFVQELMNLKIKPVEFSIDQLFDDQDKEIVPKNDENKAIVELKNEIKDLKTIFCGLSKEIESQKLNQLRANNADLITPVCRLNEDLDLNSTSESVLYSLVKDPRLRKIKIKSQRFSNYFTVNQRVKISSIETFFKSSRYLKWVRIYDLISGKLLDEGYKKKSENDQWTIYFERGLVLQPNIGYQITFYLDKGEESELLPEDTKLEYKDVIFQFKTYNVAIEKIGFIPILD